jgi:hypothetical protein
VANATCGIVPSYGRPSIARAAIVQRRRSHADEVADDLARRAAGYQGRPIAELGGASTFTDEERAAIADEFGWRAMVSMVGFVLAPGD